MKLSVTLNPFFTIYFARNILLQKIFYRKLPPGGGCLAFIYLSTPPGGAKCYKNEIVVSEG